MKLHPFGDADLICPVVVTSFDDFFPRSKNEKGGQFLFPMILDLPHGKIERNLET